MCHLCALRALIMTPSPSGACTLLVRMPKITRLDPHLEWNANPSFFLWYLLYTTLLPTNYGKQQESTILLTGQQLGTVSWHDFSSILLVLRHDSVQSWSQRHTASGNLTETDA